MEPPPAETTSRPSTTG